MKKCLVQKTVFFYAFIFFICSIFISGAVSGTVFTALTAHADVRSNSVIVKLLVLNPTPVIGVSPSGGVYNSIQTVSLTCGDSGGSGCGSTYYTTDGSTPTASSSIYSVPIVISSNTTLEYFSEDINGNAGAVGIQTYVIDTVSPVTTAYPPAGTYGAPQSVILTCTDDNSGCDKTYYTTDGTVPTVYSALYTTASPIIINADTTLRFFSTDLAGNDESPVTQSYIINGTYPVTTITSQPTNPSTVDSADFTFTSDKPGTFECKLDDSAYSSCTSPQSYAGLSNGTHTFTVRSIDEWGDVEPSPPFVTWLVNVASLTFSPPTTGGSTSGSTQFIITDFSIQASSTSAIVSWFTSEPAVSSVSWGPGMDAASGSISEIKYSTHHEILIDHLHPGEEYSLVIWSVSQYGAVIYGSYEFYTPQVLLPPPNVSDFTAGTSFGGNVEFTWKNPPASLQSGFNSVIVTCGTRFFPRDPGEGYIVYQGKGESALYLAATPGGTYYCSAFSEGVDGMYSSGVATVFSFHVPASAQSTTSQTTPLFGGAVSFLSTGNVADIIFLNGETILRSEIENATSTSTSASSAYFIIVHDVNQNLPLTVRIPASIVPRDTEEIIMKVSDRESGGGYVFFIFKQSNDGSYETTVPADFAYGDGVDKNREDPFIISFLGIGSEIRTNGIFMMASLSAGSSFSEGNNSGFSYLKSMGFYNIWFYIVIFICILIAVFIVLHKFFKISYRRRKNDDKE